MVFQENEIAETFRLGRAKELWGMLKLLMKINSIKMEEKYRQYLKSILTITEDEFVRKKELGSALDFSEIVFKFRFLKEKLKELNDERINFDMVPDKWNEELETSIKNIHGAISDIQQFDPVNSGNSNDTRSSYIASFRSSYDKLFEKILPILSAIEHIRYDDTPVKIEEGFSIIHTMESMEKEAQEILEKVKKASGETGISLHAETFRNASKEFKENARNWQYFSISSIILLIISGTLLLFFSPTSEAGATVLQNTLNKVIIITGLIYLVTLCLKNFRANKHNYIVNKHRADALTTFEVFISAANAEDIQTKNAILLKATETIFGYQPSGYLPSNQETADLSPKVIEIFKNSGGS